MSENIKDYGKEFYAAINKINYEIAWYQSSEKKGLISYSFPEMIDFELEMYTKAYMYDFNIKHYGTFHENKVSSFSLFIKEIKEYLEDLNYADMSLKDKCLLVQAHSPSKLFGEPYNLKDCNLKFSKSDVGKDYDYNYLINLNIVWIGSGGGNHRMLVQSLQNNDIKAKLRLYDDIKLLENFITDGGYLIDVNNPNNKIVIPDYKLAIIFRLTQLKLELNV